MAGQNRFGRLKRVALLPFALGLSLAFQNCGPTEVKMAGGMEQQLSIAPGTAEQVESMYQSVFGRLPSAAELSQYMSLLASGISEAQLRSQLAQSQEARSNVSNALQENFGTVNPLLLSSYTSLLGSSMSYSQLLSLLQSAR